MAEAYKVKADVSFARPLRFAEQLADGTDLYESVGVNYPEGSYVLESELTPRNQERAKNGELDHLLEPASVQDAEDYRNSLGEEYSTFVPEHEAESFILNEYGHEVVPKEQLLELKSAGADAAREDLEAAKEAGLDERDLPGLPQEPVAVPEGTEQVPGIPIPSVEAGDVRGSSKEESKPAPKKQGKQEEESE